MATQRFSLSPGPSSAPAASSSWRAARKSCWRRPAPLWQRSATRGPPSWRPSCCESTRIGRRQSASRPRRFEHWVGGASAPTAATTTSPRLSSSKAVSRLLATRRSTTAFALSLPRYRSETSWPPCRSASIPRRAPRPIVLVGFHFPDVDESYAIHVRRGVAEFQRAFPENPDVAITVDSAVWREIAVGLRNPALTFASGAVEVKGSTLDLVGFLRLFD